MSELKDTLINLEKSENINEKSQICSLLINTFMQDKRRLEKADAEALSSFVFAEMEKLINIIPKEQSYKMRDSLFDYEDKLMGLLTVLIKNNHDINKSDTEVAKTLISMVENAMSLENSIKEMLENGVIQKNGIDKAVTELKTSKDEYRRARLWQCLLDFDPSKHSINDDAKTVLCEFADCELSRLLEKSETLSEDEINHLEILCDVCKHFADRSVLEKLQKILSLKHDNVRFYAVETLLGHGYDIPATVIDEMAHDLVYAELTYSLLKRYGKVNLFPESCRSPEYLAKSDMVHWLVYPTELGKEPDEIELLGTLKSHGELFHVFKYRSDSDNLGDDLKNKWLIGWSSNDGGTFSNFDELSVYEQKDIKKTLKVIKKRLIG